MRTCGIDLKGNEAIIVCLDGHPDQYLQIASDTKKIILADSSDQEEVMNFQQKMADFLRLHQIEKVGIKERATKGKFAGGPASFKMEGLIQCNPMRVCLVHTRTLQSKQKNQNPATNIKVNQYQQDALAIAAYLLQPDVK